MKRREPCPGDATVVIIWPSFDHEGYVDITVYCIEREGHNCVNSDSYEQLTIGEALDVIDQHANLDGHAHATPEPTESPAAAE